MIEWRVTEQRDQVSWSGGESHSSPAGRSRPGILNYLVAGLTLVVTGVVAFFAFSFLILFILPVLLVGGVVMWWRWRRLIQAHQRQANRSPSGTPQSQAQPKASFSSKVDDQDVIDV
jgi:Flp pilus assembly protein TadB